MSGWRRSSVGDEIELAYGRSLPERARIGETFGVYGSNGRVGSHSEAVVDGPGIIVGRKGSFGRVTYSHEAFWPIDTTYFVIQKREHNWRFLYHLLRHHDLTTLNSHSTIPGLNRQEAYGIEVLMPDRQVEDIIAAVLDLLEKAVGRQTEAMTQTRDLKSAAVQRIFTTGLRGETPKETEIGRIPAGWDLRALSELCDIYSGGTPTKANPLYWGGDVPWVSGKDLKRPALSDAKDHITTAGLENGSRLAPSDSVLVLVRGMGLAKDLPVCVIDRPMAFNQDIKALVGKTGYSGRYLRSAIYAGKERLLSRLATSAHGTKTLNLHDLEGFLVPTPPTTTEADEITELMDALDRKMDLHRRKREVLDQLFKLLLHKLMTGEISIHDLDLSALPADGGNAA